MSLEPGGPSVSAHDRTFEIEGERLAYPTEFRDGCSAAGLFLVKSKVANAYIADSGFELAEVAPGRGIFVLTGVRYTDSDCGKYDETAMAFFVKRAGQASRKPSKTSATSRQLAVPPSTCAWTAKRCSTTRCAQTARQPRLP